MHKVEDYIHLKNPKDIQSLLDKDIRIRNLTPLEYWRLQGFKDKDFYSARKALADSYKGGDIEKTDAQLYKQAGNSINTNVLESFMGEVLESITITN